MKLSVILVGGFFTLIVFSHCSGSYIYKGLKGGPYYFSSTKSYSIPAKPTHRITKLEADELKESGYAFGVAYFDSSSRVVKYMEYYDDNVVSEVEYYYDKDGKLFETRGVHFIFTSKNGEKKQVKKTETIRCYNQKEKMVKMVQRISKKGEIEGPFLFDMIHLDSEPKQLSMKQFDEWRCEKQE